MKKRVRIQCRTDLKLLRNLYGLSKETVAETIFCSVRGLERIEKENATTNEETAIRLCKLYDIDYEGQFYYPSPMEEYIRDIYAGKFNVKSRVVKDGYTYYYLYVWRVAYFEERVFGKGLWIRNYGKNKEIRVLREIDINGFLNVNTKVPVINEGEEWKNWYHALTVGKINKIVISRKCMEECLRDCLEEHIVYRDEMFYFDGTTDLISLGTKKNKMRRREILESSCAL